jgi:hypothetical protein
VAAGRPGQAGDEKEVDMTSVLHEQMGSSDARGKDKRIWLLVPEVAASTAISVMWIVVLCDALWGPSIVTSSGAGTTTSSVPSTVVLALFAFLGTWAVARNAFDRR